MFSPHGIGRTDEARTWGERAWAFYGHVPESILSGTNDMSQFMRAERPYCLAHGGNVAAGRHAKTPNVNGGTPSRATRDQPL